MPQLRKTPLHDQTLAAGAKMAPFAGWELPLHFGSQVAEHHSVRKGAGLFDVSHMAIFDVSGADALALLQRVLAADAVRLDEVGKALYSVMLNEDAGIIDDLIVYRLQQAYRLVANASVRELVGAWLARHAPPQVDIAERDLAMMALQGPHALELFALAQGGDILGRLQPFHIMTSGTWAIARTGYTGEDGIELMVPNAEAPALWQGLVRAGAQPAGLGARDTLRLEAGFKLNGQDMDSTLVPQEAGLSRCVHWHPESRNFIGRAALAARLDAGVQTRLLGLVLEGRGVMRPGQQVVAEGTVGIVTSGLFSPTLGCSIALARLPRGMAGLVEVLIRGKPKRARVVRPPFVRHGRAAFEAARSQEAMP